MESEQRISQARRGIRHLLTLHGKRGMRIHKIAAEDNVNRLRALDGLCGNCVNLRLDFEHRYGKNLVIVQCNKGHMPSELYENTPFGEAASCPGFEQK